MKYDMEKLKYWIEKVYLIGEVESIEPIKEGVSNTNLYITAISGEKFVGRLCSFAVENQIQNMIPFLVFAENNNFPAPRVVRQADDRFSSEFEGTPFILFRYIDGEPGASNPTTKQLKSFAALLAKLHGFHWVPEKESSSMSPSHIFYLYKQIAPKFDELAFPASEVFVNTLQSEHSYQKEIIMDLCTNSTQGLTHNDPIPENVRFDGDTAVALLDLEEIGVGPVLFDIGRTLNTWCFKDGVLDFDRASLFTKEYEKVRQLSEKEREDTYHLARFVAFRHAVYIANFLVQGRIQSPNEYPDYGCLKYWINSTADEFVGNIS